MKNFTEQFKLHDKYQLEMKFTYPVAAGYKENEYSVDTFIFLPTNLGVNRSTYRKEDFYTDMHDYIRLKTPAVRLSGMSGENSPLERLEKTMTALAEETDGAAADYVSRLKMFCSILRSALRDQEALIEQALKDPEAEDISGDYLSQSETVLAKFRALYRILCVQTVEESARELFRHADEFLGITLNKYRCKLWTALERMNPAERDPLRKRIGGLLESEIAYRKLHGYPSIPDPESDNEEIVYREGTLKKAMASVLFLRTETRKDGVLLENLFFCIAAGIAMVFASAVAYFTQDLLTQELSVFFFAILVLAYMGKDRIKDLLKAYFSSKIRRFIHDYKTRILSENGERVGFCRESFNFISESAVPPDVSTIRHKAYLSSLENGCFGEQVILARKQVRIDPGACAELFRDFKVDGIVDIMRFNVRRFLWKMDNPVKPISIPDGKGGIVTVNAKRVYHVNIVIRYGMKDRVDSYARFRVVLSRNGIRRIDIFPVVTREPEKNGKK